jgi:hypothetical protein
MRFLKVFLFLFSNLGLLASSCKENPDPRPETNYEPVLMKRDKLNNGAIKWQGPQHIQQPGKIYYKDSFIFINQKYEGLHVVRSQASGQLEKVGFIRIPGNLDVAIKDAILYADNATDLIAIDLQHLLEEQSVRITKRVENALPGYSPPDNGRIPDAYQQENRPPNTVIVRWKPTSN